MNPQGSAPLTITPVEGRADREAFIRLPWAIYRDDPVWTPPLLMERREHIDPRKNPFFDQAETRFWLARRGDRTVGRISAQVNHAHLKRYDDATGHFGMLEAEDDGETFAALLATAQDWLVGHGMKRVVGPFSLSINEESGLLVEGFDTPAMILMGHSRPYYAGHLEALGYAKVKDLICYFLNPQDPIPDDVTKFSQRALRTENVVVRHIEMRRFSEELGSLLDIFNDAWADNWGFLPMSDAEITHMAKALKPILRSTSAVIAEIDGEAVAMAVTLPNINEAVADLDGRLMPFGWAKLLWRIKVRTTKSIRLPLMGVRRRFHGSPQGAALAFTVITATWEAQRALGVVASELSWILDDNKGMRRIIERVGSKVYKTYRLYERALT